mmetsp:Transcript_66369/g.158800  ORF Transcript_66369/g.158800 Transcript_66369/m.158800 type:complete len:230 (+) Transcript_66369:103-792(+)
MIPSVSGDAEACRKKHAAKASEDCNMQFAKAPSASSPVKKSANTARLVDSYTARPDPWRRYKASRPKPQPAHPPESPTLAGMSRKLPAPMSKTAPLPDDCAKGPYAALARTAAMRAVMPPSNATESLPNSCTANVPLTYPFMYAALKPKTRLQGASNHIHGFDHKLVAAENFLNGSTCAAFGGLKSCTPAMSSTEATPTTKYSAAMTVGSTPANCSPEKPSLLATSRPK